MTFIQRILQSARGGALLLVTVALAVVMGPGAGGAYAGLISDAGFDSALTVETTGDGFNTQSNGGDIYDFWWTSTDASRYVQSTSGGNPDNWASKSGGNQDRARAIAYAINDAKASTGDQTLSFDFHLGNKDGNYAASTFEVRADVVGITSLPTWTTGGQKFDLNTNQGSPILTKLPLPTGANFDLIATKQLFDADVTAGGWTENLTLSVPLGTGYDVIVVRMATLGADSGNVVGFDNVQLVPEPATLALVAMGGLGLLARRRRR